MKNEFLNENNKKILSFLTPPINIRLYIVIYIIILFKSDKMPSVKSDKIGIYNNEYVPELIELRQIAVAIIISS